MRLINADGLNKVIERNFCYPECLKQIVDIQPTAYDVDKVVEQLEEESNKCKSHAKHDTAMAPYHRGVSDGYRFSVGIVRKGLGEDVKEEHPAGITPEHEKNTYKRPVVYDPAAAAEYVCDNLCRFSHDNTLIQEELEGKCEACGMSKLLGITEEIKDTTNGDPVSNHQEPWKHRIMERFTEVN